MTLPEGQLAELKTLYETLDSKRHTQHLNEFLRADSRLRGMMDTLHVLGVSLEDFEQITGNH